MNIRVRSTFPRFAASLVWFVWCSAVVSANPVNLETVENGFKCLHHYCHRRGETEIYLFHYIDPLHAEYIVGKLRRGNHKLHSLSTKSKCSSEAAINSYMELNLLTLSQASNWTGATVCAGRPTQVPAFPLSCGCLTANMHQTLGCLSIMQGAPRVLHSQYSCNTVELSTFRAAQHEGVSDSTTVIF
jgi:hypothetical protein